MTEELYKSDEFAEAWDKHHQGKEDVLRTRLMNKILAKEISSLSGKQVLDAGCGNGFFLNTLNELNPNKIFACDISPKLVEIAGQRHPTVEFEVADICKLPYADHQFDVAVCYSVLMNVTDPAAAIKELARVTKETVHVSIVHPLYNLFVNDVKAKAETPMQRLAHYSNEEAILVDTIPGFDKFTVYRRPLSSYLNWFAGAGLHLEKVLEVTVPAELAELNEKYKDRVGVPVFAYFRLGK